MGTLSEDLYQDRCSCYDRDHLAYHLLIRPDTATPIKARILERISNAVENENDCLIVPLSSVNRLIKVSTRCPLNCESKYTVSSGGQKKEYSGHQYRVRFTLMIHLILVLDTSGEQEAFDLLTQTDKSRKPY